MSQAFFVAALILPLIALGCQHEVTMSWMLPVSSGSSWPPAYAAGKIFGVQTGSGVSVVDETQGTIGWSVTDADVVGGPALSSNNVIVAKVGSIVSLSAADGSVVAQFSLGAADEVPCRDGAPVVADGKIYFGTSAGKVYALDAATLSSVWTADLGATNGVSAPVSLWSGFVVAGTYSGNVFLIDSDGSIARSYSTPNIPEFDASNGVIYGIQTGFAISGNIAYYGTNTDTNAVALNLRSMTALWLSTLSEGSYSYSTPVLNGNSLYTTTHDGRMFAVDISSGNAQWIMDLGERVGVRGPLLLVDGSVVVTTSSGSIAGIHSNTRDMDFWFAFGAAGAPRSAAIAAGGLRLVVSGEHMIYPLGLSCRV